MRRLLLCVLTLFILVPMTAPPASGDGCYFHIPDFDVLEPGQKAICAWNGEEETMILSVDVYSTDGETSAVHVIPFPSEPSYELADAEGFARIEDFMRDRTGYWSNKPSVYSYIYNDVAPGGDGREQGGEILSREKVGPHDITVAHMSSSGDFSRWANGYFKTQGLSSVEIPEEADAVVEHYLDKGVDYFVFDVIEVGETQKAVDPLAYTFRTDELYYPLKISSIIPGYSTVDLALISPTGMVLDYSSMHDLGFFWDTTNTWDHGSFEEYDPGLASLLPGDVMLDHFKAEHMKLAGITGDVELPAIETLWVTNEDNHLFMPSLSDHDGDGSDELLYYTDSGVVLLDPSTGEYVWTVDTGEYANYNDVHRIDLDGDGVEELIFHTNHHFYAVDTTDGAALMKEPISSMRSYELVDDRYLYIYQGTLVKKIDLGTGEKLWENDMGPLDTFTGSMSWWEYERYFEEEGQYMNGSQWYGYEWEQMMLHLFDLYCYPFQNDQFVKMSPGGDADLLLNFRNWTCLIDDATGGTVWQTLLFNNTNSSTRIDTLSTIPDQDSDGYPEVTITTVGGSIYLSGADGAPMGDLNHTSSTRAMGTPAQFNSRTDDVSRYEGDLDGDGEADTVEIFDTPSDPFNITYRVHYSSQGSWTEKMTLYLGAWPNSYQAHIEGPFIVFDCGFLMLGVGPAYNQVVWELGCDRMMQLVKITDADGDAGKEVLVVAGNRVFAMDIPAVPIEPRGDEDVTFGPFTYDDGETPLEDTTIILENVDGVVFAVDTDENGEASFEMDPGEYECHLRKGDYVYVEEFTVVVSDGGAVTYKTSDGEPPASHLSASAGNDPPARWVHYLVPALILLVVIVVALSMAVGRRRGKGEDEGYDVY